MGACDRSISDPASLYANAELLRQRGEFTQAKAKADLGYETYQQSDLRWAAKFRLLQVQLLIAKGKYKPALTALAESNPVIFKDCETAVRRHLLEAIVYDRLGDYSKVEAEIKQAETSCQTVDADLEEELAIRRGELVDNADVAEVEYKKALSIDRARHDSFREARALLDLSNAAQMQEYFDESINWAKSCLEICKTKGYKVLEEKAEGNLAWNYFKLGDFDKALSLSAAAEASSIVLGSGDEQIRWRNNLGLIHEKMGQFELADSDYRRAFSLAQQQGDKLQAAIALGELALVSIRGGKWDDADKFSKQAIQAAREEQDDPLEQQASIAQALILSHRGDDAAAEALLLTVTKSTADVPQSLRWEAQAALADLYAKEKNPKAANSEYRTALDTASRARCTIHKEDLRLPFFANTARLYDSYIDFLVQQGQTVEALKTADQSRALTLAEGLGVEGKNCLASEAGLAPQKIAKRLQATILFYWLGSSHSYLWVVTPAEIKLVALPAAAEIEPLIQAYRKSLLGSQDPLQADDKSGEQLYQTLVAPAAGFVSRNGRVILVTDGNLSGLSFDSLIAPQPQPHYWIEDVTLANASSLRLLAAQTGRRTNSASRLLLMGNAAASGDPDFPPLLHASEEMRGVGGHFLPGQEQMFAGDRATVAGYVDSHPDAFSYIHFVAHGTASVSDPLDSAVVLSPASPGGSYKLYARDVIAHPLHAELVTISACKGAGTRAYTGEGLVGLSWAFLHAGAHNVIGALWDVSDESTPQLMDRMYAELAKGSAPDVALRAAKLSLLHSGSVFRKPVYWAAFQVYTGS